jgi:transcriptional regulator with XRE-family HTH domain
MMSQVTGCLYKYQLADRLGVSTRTLSRWLNSMYYEQLKKLGYHKNQKYLLPDQVRFLQGKLDFE